MKPETIFFDDIKNILAAARNNAYTVVNSVMVEAYWLIGKRIVEEEQGGADRATYGERILENLSKELLKEFGKGFSYANLYNMRQFYLTYPQNGILYTLCRKLTWSHNRIIMRVEDKKAREYYLNETALQNWSVRQLERNINTLYYQRILASNKTHKVANIDKNNEYQIHDFIKDPYVFEFLNIPQPLDANETEIEILLPPFPGQNHIMAKLDAVMQKVESIKQPILIERKFVSEK